MIHHVTADDGHIEEYAKLTRDSKQVYADKWGHEYHYLNLTYCPQSVSVYWRLIWSIKSVLDWIPDGDWIFFSGADAVIIDQSFDLAQVIDEKYDLLITYDKHGLNNNGFLLRAGAWGRLFIEKIWSLRGQTFRIVGPDGVEHSWEEQGAFITILDEMGESHIKQIPQEITNGYPPEIYGDYYKPPVFMAHFPGKKTEERVYFIRRALGLVPTVPLPGEGWWIDASGVERGPQ